MLARQRSACVYMVRGQFVIALQYFQGAWSRTDANGQLRKNVSTMMAEINIMMSLFATFKGPRSRLSDCHFSWSQRLLLCV